MNAHESVQRCWTHLTRRHGFAGAASQSVLDELLRAYAEPHRAYHTLDHIAALLRLLHEHGGGAADRDALVLAILFHDVVYDPARPDNEAMSSALASKCLLLLGVSEETIARVARHILATQHGAGRDPARDADLDLLLDLDLSVLAASPGDYRAYAQAIRQEFAIYPDEVYRPGRRRVLEGFLGRERIYLTERLRSLWEAAARANLASELAELQLS